MVIVPPFLPPLWTSVWLAPWTPPELELEPPPPQPAATKASAPAAMPATTKLCRLIHPPSCRCPWVEGVGDSVAEQVEREHREEQRAAREGEVPPRRAVDGSRVGEHLPPAGSRRLDADAEIRQCSLEQDVLRNDQCRIDDDRRDEAREDLAEHHRPAAGAART